MASPRERDHRGEIVRARNYDHQIALPPVPRPGRRHHFHDAPPWPHRHHHDYIRVDDRWGWWPRWYPYSDPGWYQYWWQLYDYYGGDASPEYAEYARDAILRQRAPELGLVVSGGDTQGMGSYGGGYYGSGHTGGGYYDGGQRAGGGYYDGGQYAGGSYYGDLGNYYGGTQVGRHTPPVEQRPHYQHPHYHYGDYVTFNGTWWPRWYPYSDPSWYQYWWQLYHYYGGDAHRDYAEYARDALLRTQMRTR